LHANAFPFKLAGMIRSLPLLCAAALVAAPLFAADTSVAAAAAATTAPKNVSPDEAEKLLKANPKTVVIDVRTPEEFKAGHIPGAKNIDFLGDDFTKQIAALDKSRTYLLHCASGGRSGQACKTAEVQSLPSVYHLNQGFKAWQQAGKPVEK
jgi:rhodanese-related sulfurtransferase